MALYTTEPKNILKLVILSESEVLVWVGWCKQQMTNYPYIHKEIKNV